MAKTALTKELKPEVNLTRQREAILKVIRGREDHPTANEIFQAARLRLPGISYATVYNSLRFLKEAGLVLEIKFGDSASRYDRETGRHDHAICNCCGKLVDFDLPQAAELMRAAARKSKFQPASVHLTLRGVCPDCHEPNAKGPRPRAPGAGNIRVRPAKARI
jgi:Fur family peroxide stress response transcriptional regulator